MFVALLFYHLEFLQVLININPEHLAVVSSLQVLGKISAKTAKPQKVIIIYIVNHKSLLPLHYGDAVSEFPEKFHL